MSRKVKKSAKPKKSKRLVSTRTWRGQIIASAVITKEGKITNFRAVPRKARAEEDG